MTTHTEQIEKAEQSAALLAADLRGAVDAALPQKPTATERVIVATLLPLIAKAREVRQRLADLRATLATTAEVQS